MSNGDEWGSWVEKGGIACGCNDIRVYYSSTVIDTEVRLNDDHETLCVKAAFRKYYPNGNKTDNNSEAFCGWRETFDEWMSAYG
jgi:hypothetical protein